MDFIRNSFNIYMNASAWEFKLEKFLNRKHFFHISLFSDIRKGYWSVQEEILIFWT